MEKCKADENVIDLPISRTVLPTDPAEDPVALGRDAWRRRRDDAKTSWADWLLIGKALKIARKEVLGKLRIKKPAGKKYNDAFGEWLEFNGFDGFDKSDRSKLLQLMDEIDAVEAYRATLTEAQRGRLNHPTSLWRRYKCPQRRRKFGGYSSRRDVDDTGEHVGDDAGDDVEQDDAETEKWHGQLILEAQKAAGAARSYAAWSGDVDPGVLQEVRAAAEEWTKLAERLERLEGEQRGEPRDERAEVIH